MILLQFGFRLTTAVSVSDQKRCTSRTDHHGSRPDHCLPRSCALALASAPVPPAVPVSVPGARTRAEGYITIFSSTSVTVECSTRNLSRMRTCACTCKRSSITPRLPGSVLAPPVVLSSLYLPPVPLNLSYFDLHPLPPHWPRLVGPRDDKIGGCTSSACLHTGARLPSSSFLVPCHNFYSSFS